MSLMLSNVCFARKSRPKRRRLTVCFVSMRPNWQSRAGLLVAFAPRNDVRSMKDLLQKQPRALVLRIAEEIFRLVDFNDLSVVHEDDAIGDLPGKAHLVGDHQHDDAVA